MILLLLDRRWPTMLPLAALKALDRVGRISYTQEVPVSVRWNLPDVLRPGVDGGVDVLVSTNPFDESVVSLIDAAATVYSADSLADPVGQAIDAMSAALSRGEWEQTQTHRSLLPYLREETEEFAAAVEAVEAGASDAELRRELGDVLLQVLFHAEIASRRGAFNFADVAASFVAKLRARAPYLFDGSTGIVDQEEQERLWAEGKRREQDSNR